MSKLIRSDLSRVLRDKLFLITCIIGGTFAMFTPLLFKLIFAGLGAGFEDLTGAYTSPKTLFFNAFSPGNNFGLIVPILLGIILYKDFTFGTIRNKIISGYTRREIFLSMFTVCFIVLWSVVLLYALFTYVVALILFGAASTSTNGTSILYFLESLAFDFLLYLFVAALVSWLCATRRNVGTVIVMYVAIMMIFTLIATIIQACIVVLSFDFGSEKTVKILTFFQRINLFYSYSYIGVGESYSLKDVLYLVITPLVGAGGLLGLGMLKFGKKDLK